MKKLLPFVFPCIAFLIVVFLAVRWYNAKTRRDDGKIADLAQDVKIDDLGQTPINKLPQMHGAKDEKSVPLTGADSSNQGMVRYDVNNGKVYFTVTADLPSPGNGYYQVWLMSQQDQVQRKAFRLQLSKGGYVGSADVSMDLLPFDITVSHKTTDTNDLETAMLKGTVPKDVTATPTPSASPTE